MAYWLNLFSPETYEAFTRSDRSVSGFRERQKNQAKRVKPGDKLVCYMTNLSRWVGMLEVIDGPFQNDNPLFYEENDPFVVRFKVKPVVWLSKEQSVPIKEPHVWDQLTFTRGQSHSSSTWTGRIRASLNEFDESDGQFIEQLLKQQHLGGIQYEVNEGQYQRFVMHRIRTVDRVISVTVPEDALEDSAEAIGQFGHDEVRESIRMQALLAQLGEKMGLSIWVPRNDRSRVEQALGGESSMKFLDILPLNYDDTTLKTIEQIDVLWLKGRAILRAFEVEHTTSVYSGILRMADLLALQPNMDIRLHIVAPETRKEKVFTELRRPVFSLLDRGPLADSCTYLSYDSVKELVKLPHLHHLSAAVLDEYAEEAD
jgi:predicted RNA-binding protein